MESALDTLFAILRDPTLAPALTDKPSLWNEIVRLAEVHRFSALLAYSAPVPPADRAWRDRILMAAHSQYHSRMRLLKKLITMLNDRGIDCVCLKGPLLAARFYPVPFLKTSHDLDLLIRISEVAEAARLLEGMGLRLIQSDLPWSWHRRFSHHLNFSDERTGTLELHYALKAGATPMPAQEFLDRRTVWRDADGFEFQVLSPADEVFYLIVHAAGHAFHRMRWLYDAKAVAGTLTDEEKKQVADLATQRQMTGFFVAADMAYREFLGEGLPLDLKEFQKPKLWSPLRTQDIRRMADREVYRFGVHALDVCRMIGTPAAALQLCLKNGEGRLSAAVQRLANKSGNQTLAKTLASRR